MLADIVDHVIGIDPDRDRITASLVEASTGGELATEAFETTRGGYERLVAWADRHTSRESRAWAVEGSGSYGSGACAHLGAAGEQVIEFSHPRTAATSDGAKTDALDARRAAREVLGRSALAVPRARGRREALRALETTRRGAQTARTAAINELKALIVSAPVDLRDQLRGLTTAAQVAKCAAFRLPAAPLDELTATKQALRSLARRIKTLTAEAADLQTSIRGLVEAVAPHLLDQPGVGPVTAAQLYIAWSHPGRCRNEAAFARLAGVAPLEASSGQNTRHRLNRRGDRQLNRALHTIAVTRSRYCPHTQAYIAKRTAEGKTPREAQRCLKRYIARQIYRLLQHPKNQHLTNIEASFPRRLNMCEPLLTHRNETTMASKLGSVGGLGIKARCGGSSVGELAVCGPGGARCIGGVSSSQALAWNRRTCRPDRDGRCSWPRGGEPQAANTASARVPMRGTGADRPVVAVRAL